MRSFILRILHLAGFFRLWLRYHPKSITILMLHGVMDDEDKVSHWHPFRSYLSRRKLDETLVLLSQYYSFISMDEALVLLESDHPLEKQYCVITFDDGLRNNLTHALPILRRYQVPAIMYLVTDQIEREEPYWFDRLDYALQQSAAKINSIKVFGKAIDIVNNNRKELKETFLRIKNAAYKTQHSYAEIHRELLRVIVELEAQSGKSLLDIYQDDPWSKVASWSDIESAASEQDILIGSHTVDHSLLGMISDEEMKYQLKASKETLEQHTGKPCLHFCYPNGSLNPKAPEYLKLVGYKSAVTTDPGNMFKHDFDRYHLKRYHMPTEQSALEALALISGFRGYFKNNSNDSSMAKKPLAPVPNR